MAGFLDYFLLGDSLAKTQEFQRTGDIKVLGGVAQNALLQNVITLQRADAAGASRIPDDRVEAVNCTDEVQRRELMYSRMDAMDEASANSGISRTRMDTAPDAVDTIDDDNAVDDFLDSF